MTVTEAPITGGAGDGGKSRTVTVPNRKGLHARAAARLARLAGQFQAEITVEVRGQTVSALSIMGMLMLAATRGTALTLHAQGADAEAALDALEALVACGFEED